MRLMNFLLLVREDEFMTSAGSAGSARFRQSLAGDQLFQILHFMIRRRLSRLTSGDVISEERSLFSDVQEASNEPISTHTSFLSFVCSVMDLTTVSGVAFTFHYPPAGVSLPRIGEGEARGGHCCVYYPCSVPGWAPPVSVTRRSFQWAL